MTKYQIMFSNFKYQLGILKHKKIICLQLKAVKKFGENYYYCDV